MKKTFTKRFITLLVLAGFFAAPVAIDVYAQQGAEGSSQLVAAQESEKSLLAIAQEILDEPAETPEPEPEVIEETEQPLDDADEPVLPTEVSLNEALVIAQAEHPESDVIMAKVKLKKLDDQKVYKFVFEDGWRIYVRASDGEIVRIKDAANKKHDCSHRGRRASSEWRRNRSWMKNKNTNRNRGQNYGNHQNNRGVEYQRSWWNNDRRQNQHEQSNGGGATQDTEVPRTPADD